MVGIRFKVARDFVRLRDRFGKLRYRRPRP